jgi:putative intracellular protease/amidase
VKVLVVCPPIYNGDELWPALRVLVERGIDFDLASLTPIIREEGTLKKNRPNLKVDDLVYDSQYKGMMLTSGPMKWTEIYWTHKSIIDAVQKANERGDALAAICGAVGSLWAAVEGKKVSYYPLIRVRQHLERHGAILSPLGMTRDNNLVTGEHQAVSEIWAEEFCNLLEGLPPQYILHDSGFVPMGGERKPIPAIEAIKAARAERKRNGNHGEGSR